MRGGMLTSWIFNATQMLEHETKQLQQLSYAEREVSTGVFPSADHHWRLTRLAPLAGWASQAAQGWDRGY